MKRWVLILGAFLLMAITAGLFVDTSAGAPPADFCQRRPDHPRCQTPGPTPTPSSTPAPTPTPSATPSQTPTPGGTCTNPVAMLTGNNMVNLNGYFVHNNLWNPPGGAASQTTYACSERSWYTIASGFPDNNYEVFSYPNAHKDLPNWPDGVPLSSLLRVTSSFAGVPSQQGNYNVAYDIWVNGVGWACGNTEVMIWTETRPQTLQPLGSDRGDYSINGTTYDVYGYNDGCMNVVSYKARSTVRSGTLELKTILNDGVSRGLIPANPNLSAVDYGIEIRYTGTSPFRFDATNFSMSTN